MKGFLGLTRREIDQRKLILAAAAFASLIPLALPVVRGLSGVSAMEARSWTALFLAFAFAAGIAIGLGATMLPPSMASRRIGFDFSRPVSGLAIWSGHLAAAVLLAAAAGLVIWMPTRLAGAMPLWRDLFASADVSRIWPLLAAGGLLVLFSVAHALMLMFRSRSLLLVVDAVLGLGIWFGVSAAIARLPAVFADAARLRIAVLFPIVAGLGFLAAGYVSVARGRTDVRLAHRASSLVLWTVLGAAVLVANGYSWWVMAAGPADVTSALWVAPAASGPWVEVEGSARGAQATFLYDTTTGRSARTVTVDWRGPVFSMDGTLAAWVRADAHGGPFPVWTFRLDDSKAQPAETRILLEGYPALLELSTNGKRMATMENEILSIHDLDSNTTVASARIPYAEHTGVRGVFDGSDRFRIYRTEAAAFDIFELDVRSRTLTKTGEISGWHDLRYFLTDPSGSRIVAVDGPNRRMRLFDGRTGELLATLVDEPAESRWPGFLSDGRIVVTERSGEGLRLLVFGKAGERTATIALPPGQSASAGGEMKPGLLLVGIADKESGYASWLVDLDAGSSRKIADGLRPARVLWWPVDAGSDATRLFYGPGQRSLVRLDPLTGQRKVLLGEGS